ncbi:MAG: hypothetical protein QMD85_00770 [Candidatus Aenigmarchaeota archaeon]|nr:hypothetical protein [Candidatus Aenigmarchaeota archaeon]MDI6722070.1 hypothetical protein [Candidatus Aenigmarchaeota archaeon]
MAAELTGEMADKVREIEGAFQGIGRSVRPYTKNSGNLLFIRIPSDIRYAETENYHAAAVKWNETMGDAMSDRLKQKEWVSVYYRKKSGTRIKRRETDILLTHDVYLPHIIFQDTMPEPVYGFASVQSRKDDRIKVELTDETERKHPAYTLDLRRWFW